MQIVGNLGTFDDSSIEASLSAPFSSLRRFASSRLDSPQLTVRYTKEIEIVNSDYLYRSERAIQRFDELLWSSSPESLTGDQLADWACEIHKLSVYEVNGHLRSLHPGKLRSEFDPEGYSAVSRRPEATAYVRAIFEKFSSHLSLGPLLEGPIPQFGIPEEAWPQANYDEKQRDPYVYCPGKYLPYYFASSADSLRSILRDVLNGKSCPATWVNIGDYCQTLSTARPNDLVNNSWIMNTTNYLLRLTGHEGVAHGDFDHLFIRITRDQQRKIWPLILNNFLPTAEALGLSSPTKKP